MTSLSSTIKTQLLLASLLVAGLLIGSPVSAQVAGEKIPEMQNLEGINLENQELHFKMILPTGFEAVPQAEIDDFLRVIAEDEIAHSWRHQSEKTQKLLRAKLTAREIETTRKKFSFAYAPDAQLSAGLPMILGRDYKAKLTASQFNQIKAGVVDGTPLFVNNIPGIVGVVRGKYIEAERRFVYLFNTVINKTRVRGVGSLVLTKHGFLIINVFYGDPQYSSGLELDETTGRRHLASFKMLPGYAFDEVPKTWLESVEGFIGFRIHFGVSDPVMVINPTFILMTILVFSVLGWLYKSTFED